jgi:hypothetical protein
MRAKQLAFGLAVVIGFFSSRGGEAAIGVVAYGAQQAPGMPAGVEFDELSQAFGTPRIDGQGRVAFGGSTRKPDLSLGGEGIMTAFGPLTGIDSVEPMLVDDGGRTTFLAYVGAEAGLRRASTAIRPASSRRFS